jgi:HK97 family phage major capsid protein
MSNLKSLQEKRKALADVLEETLKLPDSRNVQEKLENGAAELDGLDADIRRASVRERLDCGGITLARDVGIAGTDFRAEMRQFFAGGYKSGTALNLRSVEISELGGTTTVADPTFTGFMDRDAVVAKLATVTTVSSGAPVRFYRQSAYLAAETSATAEAATFAEKDMTGNVVDFTPAKIGIRTIVSTETLRDLPYDVASDTIRQHAELHGANWELAFLSGTNGSSLTGNVAAYSGIGSQSIWDFGATAGNTLNADLAGNTITVAEGATIAYSTGLRPQYLGNACWLLNASVWASIVSQNASTSYPFGGGQLPSIARDGSGPMDGNRSTVNFMGFPVYLTASWPVQASPATGDPIGVFGNIERGYRIVRVDTVPMIADPYTNAASGQVRFISETRQVGKILDRNAMVSIRR